jgi:hypothetical protein
MYRDLKNDLRAEAKRCVAERRVEPDVWYVPVVTEAIRHLSAPVNTNPEKWSSGLYDASFDFMHAINSTRRSFGLEEGAHGANT